MLSMSGAYSLSVRVSAVSMAAVKGSHAVAMLLISAFRVSMVLAMRGSLVLVKNWRLSQRGRKGSAVVGLVGRVAVIGLDLGLNLKNWNRVTCRCRDEDTQ